MSDLRFIIQQYSKLRDSLVNYLGKFNDESYFYQPTKVSNSPAWIVPHISAFEKVMVVDKIPGLALSEFISPNDVAIYRPGVEAYSFTSDQLMGLDDAIKLLEKTKEVSCAFLEELASGQSREVDMDVASERYLLNYSHETEHYGQLKYLLGTWKRVNGQ